MRTNSRSQIRIVVAVLLTSLFFLPVSAQIPSIKIEGKESNLVTLQTAKVDVAINGTIATTTWTMTFINKSDRILEGQLDFPLPEGIDVSRYALDINGHLREAVPVEKTKGTQVFEQIERRRVDPGLLEKVDGNIFRTRIYPIPARGTRTVLIAYEQGLIPDRSRSLSYHLPLAFEQPLKEFKFDCSVSRATGKPVIAENIAPDLQFGEWQEAWTVSRSWKNFTANRSLTIRLPIAADGMEAMMQENGGRYYYNMSAFPERKKIARTRPHHITILWDASLSGLSRDHEKEFQLLDAYLERLKEVAVTLVEFSNTSRTPRDFSVRNGDWRDLKRALEHIIYDGGTQLGSLNPDQYPSDEILLFSDGRSTYGSAAIKPGSKPVYAIVATAKSDFPALRYIAETTGGELINAETGSAAEAVDQLFFQSLYFLGVRHAAGVEESYPSQPVPVLNGISVSGIVDRPRTDLTLQFGYGGKVVSEVQVHLDYSKQRAVGIDLSRVWAQKKIAELDRRYDDHQQEIAGLGRRYGIVTRNTSLIVLETVQDYVNYDIEPPAALRAEYDAIIKGRRSAVQMRQAVRDHADAIFYELLEWWTPRGNKNMPVGKPAPETARQSAGIIADSLSPQAAPMHLKELEGRVPGLSVQSANSNQVAIRGAAQMDEVVVSGYATQRRQSVTGSVSSFKSNAALKDRGEPGISAGGSFKAYRSEKKTAYLQKLGKADPADQYAVYLRERRDNLSTPLFFYNTANFFFEAGKKDLGLRILSNIAELEVGSYELYKLLGYQLRQVGDMAAACATFKKVLDWRPFEPQSYRDYALALEDAGRYQEALDTLYTALMKNYDDYTNALYPGIEETILPEIGSLAARHGKGLDLSRIPPKWLTKMPVDIRVVLNWNMSDTDMDLWVTDPYNEKCYYSHRNTVMGGRISNDFTRGLGPEQFMLKKAVKGKYKVEVNYYGDTQVKLAGPTSVLVEVYTYYGTSRQTRRLIPLQMQSVEQRTVLVGEFNF